MLMVSIHTTKLLDRDLSNAATAQTRETAGPVLREIIDEGLRVAERCGRSANERDVHLGTVFPFLHLLEMLDGAEVCLGDSVVVPATVLLRAGFEALLTLEYVAREDSVRRGAAFVVVDVHDRIAEYDRLDDRTDRGKAFSANVSRDHAPFTIRLPAEIDLDVRRDSLRKVLAKRHLGEANQEYLRLSKSRRGRPKFYQLFGGPGDLEQLARYLGRSAQYDVFYRQWSRTSHAADLRRQLRPAEDGSAAVSVLRDPRDMVHVYGMAMSLGLAGIHAMLTRYRSGEIEGGVHAVWYKQKGSPNTPVANAPAGRWRKCVNSLHLEGTPPRRKV